MVRAVPHIVAPGQAVRLSRGTILVCFVQQTGEIFKGGENAVCVYVQRASMSEYGEDKQGARRAVATLHGASMNQRGGIYNQGVSFSFEKKLEIAAAYEAARAANNGD